ncbi:MAG: hypothetical protein DRJ03_23435 [Chloroflexi bacterium]|nr:MAG: hypothetical protein B6I35_13325 [Anaerolineaceae bacterium 4572_32.2]RLC79472.1 MAG: hypothetical protein DRJ03_23435 [Chloroflexota bacterium]
MNSTQKNSTEPVVMIRGSLSAEQVAEITEDEDHLIFDLRLRRDNVLTSETPWYAWVRCFGKEGDDVAEAAVHFVAATTRSWRALNGDAQVVFLAEIGDEEYAERFLAAVRERMGMNIGEQSNELELRTHTVQARG